MLNYFFNDKLQHIPTKENLENYFKVSVDNLGQVTSIKKITNQKKEHPSPEEENYFYNLFNELSKVDFIYLSQMKDIAKFGNVKDDRTGIGTKSIFGVMNKYDLSQFPILTTKKINFKHVVSELLWFIKGEDNLDFLREHKNPIWNYWRRPYNLNRKLVKVKKVNLIPVPCSLETNELEELITINPYEVNSIDNLLFNIWCEIMSLSYLTNSKTSVSADWQDYQRFVDEVKEIPHFWYFKKNPEKFILSNSYYDSNVYSKQTSVWLSLEEDKTYTSNYAPLKLTDEIENSEVFINFDSLLKKYEIESLEKFTNIQKGIFTNANERRLVEILKNSTTTSVISKDLFRFKIIEESDMGPIYGANWRQFNFRDQLKWVIQEIKTNPSSRRLIVSGWNPKEIENMALPPCHTIFQFYVNNNKLSCLLLQRSNDFPIGIPFNIASYALLVHLIAKECNLEVGEFIHVGGDSHIYNNQIDKITEQFNRLPYKAPKLIIDNWKDIWSVEVDDIHLENYNYHPFIKIPVAE